MNNLEIENMKNLVKFYEDCLAQELGEDWRTILFGECESTNCTEACEMDSNYCRKHGGVIAGI
jgi:hypothetical protein